MAPKHTSKKPTKTKTGMFFSEVVRPTTVIKQVTMSRGKKVNVVEKKVTAHSRMAYFPSPPSKINCRKKKVVGNSENNYSRRTYTVPKFNRQRSFFQDKDQKLQPRTNNPFFVRQRQSVDTPGPHMISKPPYLVQAMGTISAKPIKEPSQFYETSETILGDNLKKSGAARQNISVSRLTWWNTPKQRKQQSTVTTDVMVNTQSEASAVAPIEKSIKEYKSVNTARQNTDVSQSMSQNIQKRRSTITSDSIADFEVEDSTVSPAKKRTKYPKWSVNIASQNTNVAQPMSQIILKLEKQRSTITPNAIVDLQVKDSAVVLAKKRTKHQNSENTASQNIDEFQSTSQNVLKQGKRQSLFTTDVMVNTPSEDSAVVPAKFLCKESNKESFEMPTIESIEEPTEMLTEAETVTVDLVGAQHLVSEPSSLVRAMNAIMTKKISIEDALLHFNVSKKALRGAFFSKMVMKSDVKDPNLVHAVDLYLNHLWSSKRVYIKTGVTRSMLEDAIEQKQQSTDTTDVKINIQSEDSTVSPSKKRTKHQKSENTAGQNTDVSQSMPQNVLKLEKRHSTITPDAIVDLQVKDSAVVLAKMRTKHQKSENTASQNIDESQSTSQNVLKQGKQQSTVTTNVTVNIQSSKDSTVSSSKKRTKLHKSGNTASQNTDVSQSTSQNVLNQQKRESIITPDAVVQLTDTVDPQVEHSDGAPAIEPTKYPRGLLNAVSRNTRLSQLTLLHFFKLHLNSGSQPDSCSQKVMDDCAFDANRVDNGLLLETGDSAADARVTDDATNITDDLNDVIYNSEIVYTSLEGEVHSTFIQPQAIRSQSSLVPQPNSVNETLEVQLLPRPWWFTGIYGLIRWLMGYGRGTHCEEMPVAEVVPLTDKQEMK